MKKEVGDIAAIEFAVAFYDALGAGRSFEFAFRFGCNAIQLASISEHLTPQLIGNSVKDTLLYNDKKRSFFENDVDKKLYDFNSFYASSKKTGIAVHIYTHNTGLTLENANSMKKELEKEDISVVIMKHYDQNPPDSVFIGALVSAEEARIVLSKVPYRIQYIFPLDYPRVHGGDPNGLLIGIGYMSTHNQIQQSREITPLKISQSDIISLIETSVSNTDFQCMLRKLTFK